MRKFSCLVASAALLALAGCQTANLGNILGPAAQGNANPSGAVASAANGSQDTLMNLLTGLISNAVPVSPAVLKGTWHYSSPECRFESENYLAQAGGAVAATTIENKLADTYKRIGIKPGSCSITFGADNTCSMVFGGRTINGTYTLNAENHDIHITSSTGLINLSGKVYFNVTSLSLLFNADRLLSIAQGIGTFTGQGNSTLGALGQMLGAYNGLLLGMNFTK